MTGIRGYKGTLRYDPITKQWLDDDRLPEPDSDSPLVYSIIVPPGASTSDPNLGENGTFEWDDFDLGDVDNDPSNYLWVGFDGTLDFLIAEFLARDR